MTWGPMIWAIAAELFPARYRAKGMALATASNWLWNFLIGFFTPFITKEIDFAYGYVFAGCLFFGIFVELLRRAATECWLHPASEHPSSHFPHRPFVPAIRS